MARYSATPLTTMAAVEQLYDAWSRLFYTAAAGNPFTHPLWMTTWARHFVRPSELYVLAVHQGDTLVAVAPFYRRRFGLGAGLSATVLQLFGAVEHVTLTELSQVLIKPGLERPVLSAIMQHFGQCADMWDWVEIVLPPEQGWFEPAWLPRCGTASGFVLHKGTRACVVLPLPATWEELRADMKRNIKESLRRGVNSLKREGLSWDVNAAEDRDAMIRDVRQVAALHRARASINGKPRHADSLAQRTDRDFLRAVAPGMFASGHLIPYILRIEGQPAAGGLVLRANGTSFLSISGFDPRWWSYNVITTLSAECLRVAIARRDTLANLSPGPHGAKLRWSDRLQLHQEFVMVGAGRRSQRLFALYWQVRTALALRRERHRHDRVLE
jgi:Acetyltransferase (GNAT) domain